MAQSGPAPLIATDYMDIDPATAPSAPNQNEQLSQGMQNPAFAYAWTQNRGLFPPAFEGDNATIDAIFAVAQSFKTPPATPVLSSLAPNTSPANSPAFLMTITGTGFTPGASVVFGTIVESRVTFVSATTLTVQIYPGYIPTPGTIQVKVRPGGGAADSNALPFTVT
ncbi:MAG TPA: IPT/TIG domain-containing protein [Chthoniobacterales bacterium]|nr:IPT/TIG domain-containing protein [Chthoniobacterales bacterium]